VIDALDDVFLSISMTTRPKSAKEIDGLNYHFRSEAEFRDLIEAGEFLEYAEVFGNYYGTPLKPIRAALGENRTVILEIDVQGARQAKRLFPEVVLVFILPPTQQELSKRLNDRGRDDKKAAERRLDGASAEIAAAWQLYEHMVINDDLDQAVQEVVKVIKNGDI
jgi:guanylate kinase